MADSQILLAEHDGVYVLKLVGNVRFTICHILDNALCDIVEKSTQPVVVDLTQATMLDSTTLGVLAQIAISGKDRFGVRPNILVSNSDVKRILLGVCFDQVFSILEKEEASGVDGFVFSAIDDNLQADEAELQEKVLNAHRTLCDLSEKNRDTFQNVLETLEEQAKQSKKDK